MIRFKLSNDSTYIELIKLLKAVNICGSGGEAKQLVDDGQVKLNGQVENRKRAKLKTGDIIEVFDNKIIIE